MNGGRTVDYKIDKFSHSQRLFGLMVICFLVSTTVAGDLTQAPMPKGNNYKTMLIAGASLLGLGFCAWKLMNHYNRNALPKDVPAVLAGNRVNSIELPQTVNTVEISHGLLTLQQGNDPSLRVMTRDSETMYIDQAAHLSAHRLRLQHPSALRYILTLTQIPKVLIASGDSEIAADTITTDTLELQTRDRSKINIKNLMVNTVLSVHRTGPSSITARGKWNVDVYPNRFEMHGKGGSTRMTKHNQQETVVKIIASQGNTSFGVSVD